MRTHHHRPYRNMPSTFNGWLLLGVYVSSLILLTCSQTIADSSKGCEERQHKCICGTPRCIEPELVKNGVQDCQDGSDEGQWDPSKCAIKNNTSEDIRFKRAALSELSRLTKNGATTTFFSGDRGRTRPVGLLTTTMGSFVTSGTTTEYITKVLATYIKGTYARIVSTSSRIYHAIPTEGSDMMDAIRPTGFIASTVSNEINGYATTGHTTDIYRTYIDGTYAQLVSSYSNVHYPPWYTDKIVATAANSLPGTTVQGAAIYATPAVVEPAEPSLSSEYLFEAANTDARVRTVIVPTRVVPISQNTLLPAVLHGRIDAGKNAVAGLGIVESNNKIQAFRPNNKESEIKVTGTHGKFVQTGSPGEETTYNVFTGTYLQNSKTFLFFFGNTALEPAKTVAPAVMPTLQVENGPPKSNNVVLDMSKNLKVIIPQDQERIPIQGSIQGSQMEGILVEIEASEPGDYVTVDGAVEDSGTPRSPQIDKITVTLGLKDLGLEPSQVYTSSSSRPPVIEVENEIPTGRKVPDLRPSSARQFSLPTFTVGQETEELEYATTENVQRDYADAPAAVSTSSRKSAPVFQRAGSSPPPQKIASPALTKPRSPSLPKAESPRSSRAFQMKDLMEGMNEAENDLQSAASTGRATVTYVGFADFTTTVGNTVIIFAPRTKIVEDMAIKAAKTASPTIEPTAILYGTTKQPEEETTTTTSTSSTSSRPSTSTEKRTERPPTTTPKSEDEETTELEPSETTIVTSGRQTVFVEPPAGASLLTPQFKPVATPELPTSPSRSFTPTRKTVFPTLSRSRFLPKHLQQKSSSRSSSSAVVEPTPIFKPFVPEANKATTVVLQPGKHNPIGLVSSIGNSVVNDGSTTLFTTLVYGTFIQSSYAQVIKSTSQVIAPSSVRLLSSSKPVVTYEYTTTEHVDDDENTTIPNIVQYERTESSTSSTTESSSTRKTTTSKPEEPETTTQAQNEEDDEEYTTTTSTSTSTSTTPKSIDEDKENEVETARKVQGRPRDQVIVPVEDKPEEGQEGDNDDEDQTIYITRTVPTTLFRTYTYFTTYFLPQEGTTITSVTSREETSTAVGVVKKTFASVIPTASASLDPEDEELEPSRAEDEDEIEPTGSQILYKTFFTTYTYLTTFFTGQTTSVSSREEVVSNVVTLTQSKAPAATPPSSVIEPTSSAALLSSVQPTRLGRLSVIRKSRTKSTPSVEPTQELEPEPSSSAEVEPTSPSVVTATVHKTFFTTYTYFTTLFNGEDTSIKSRTEVITNVVPTVTRIVPSATEEAVEATSEATPTDEYEEEEEDVDDAKETTFYTTYTHLTTFFVDDTESLKSSLATYTRVLKGNKILRTGKVDEPIEPTSLSGRSVVRPTAVTPAPTEAEDLNEVGSNLSETSETTARSTSEQPEASTESVSHADYYELDGSEGTTHATTYDDESSKSEGPVEPEIDGTPALRTYFTTFTFYTTFYKAGTSTVNSRLETVTNVVSDVTEKEDATSTSEPAYPITYYTTYTYWTTSFKEGSPVVTSREETVSNVVTPGVDDVAPSTVSSSSTEIQATSTSAAQDSDLTTYFTTYTYYTTSYLKDETVVTSRLETVTNVISGSDAPTTEVSPTAVEGRAVGTVKPEISDNDQPHDEDDDYDLPTGLLSTIISSEVVDMTTTVHSTDVYGTYIDGIYAQVLESTSLLISPTASLETSFIPDATVSETGLVSVNQGAIKDADGAATTFFTTKAYGTIIDGSYAHLLDKTSSVLKNENISPSEDPLKTGLVRIIDGSIVEGEQTTYYTSSILGTIIDNQYAQVIESTSRYVINPTRADDGTTVPPTRLAELESSEAQTTTEDIPTTTEAASEEKKSDPLRRLPGARGRGSNRLSFTSASKSFTPLITPFASRSRPAFAPRRRQSSAIVVSRTDVTPTVTASLAASTSATPSSRGSSFANRRRPAFRGSEAAVESTTASSTASEATPRLPFAPGRSRFSRPTGPARPSAASIAPTSTSSRGSSFAGGLGSSRRGGFNARGSSSVRNPSLARSSRPGATVSFSTSANAIRGSSSRFNPRGRSTAAIRPSSTEVTTVKPTSQLAPQDEEYEIIEYEYEEPVSSSTSSTTEKPSTPASRGGNRFRLNPRLSTPNPPSTTTNAPRIAPARNIPSLRKNIFTRPTPSTRGTTAAATPSDDDEAQEEAPVPTTPKPRPTFNNRARTTLAPITTTTTRRTFAPRQRPQNFPSRGLFRPASTTASTEKDEDEGELEYEETRNIASANLTAIEPQADGSNRYETYVRAPEGFSNSHRGDLIGSGSEFYSNIVPAAGDDDEEGEYPRARPNARVLRRAPRQVDQYGYRYRGSSSNNYNRRQVDNNARSNSRSSSSFSPQPSYYSDYYDDSPEPPATPAPVPSTRGSSRFRGRITPTPSQTNARRTPFTLTNSDSSTSRPTSSNSRSSSSSGTNSNSFSRRSQSRYQRPSTTEAPTTSRSSRFRSRYRQTEATTSRSTSSRNRFPSSSRTRGSTTFTDRNRYDTYNSPKKVEADEPIQLGTITVTHYVPAETTIPVVNGKVTEYKTILTPSASKEVLGPHQYSLTDYGGAQVLAINSELTSTPSFGVTEVTRFIIRESATTSVTFTPTTIRGRRTSFSHIVPSTVYSVEPVVSTLAPNPLLTDQNQLTNLLLSQLLGNLNLNPNLLGLQQQQQALQQQQLQGLMNNQDPATPITHFNTRTTSYVTTVTDFTSTVLPITLHGKSIKTTIVESSTHVITATEFITDSTVITPTPQMVFQPTLLAPLNNFNNNNNPGINPALLQNLLQQQLLQQQQQQQQQQQLPILPTQPPQLILPTLSPTINSKNSKDKEHEQEEESNVKNVKVEAVQEKNDFSVVTLYVSGRNPGEFSTVVSTVPLDSPKRKRSVDHADYFVVVPTQQVAIQHAVEPTKLLQSSLLIDPEEVIEENLVDYYGSNSSEGGENTVTLESSYDSNTITIPSSSRHQVPTQSLDSVLGDVSRLISQSAR